MEPTSPRKYTSQIVLPSLHSLFLPTMTSRTSFDELTDSLSTFKFPKRELGSYSLNRRQCRSRQSSRSSMTSIMSSRSSSPDDFDVDAIPSPDVNLVSSHFHEADAFVCVLSSPPSSPISPPPPYTLTDEAISNQRKAFLITGPAADRLRHCDRRTLKRVRDARFMPYRFVPRYREQRISSPLTTSQQSPVPSRSAQDLPL